MDEAGGASIGGLPSPDDVGPERSDSSSSASSTLVQLVAAALVIVVVVVTVFVELGSGVSETDTLRSSANVADATLNDAYFACLTRQVEGLIPPERPVWASTHSPNGVANAVALKKVLAPYAPLSVGSSGLVRLYLINNHHHDGCLGVRVKAVWPDGTVRLGTGSLVTTVPHEGAEQ